MPAPARAQETPIDTLSLEERIRRRAYELFLQRGTQSGSELDDWLQAEEEIRRAEEEAIDEASEDSFPASDPPAYADAANTSVRTTRVAHALLACRVATHGDARQ